MAPSSDDLRIARAALRRQDYATTIQLTQDILRVAPLHPPAMQLLALAHAELGNRESAIELLTAAADAHPGVIDLHAALAQQLIASGQTARARRVIDDARKNHPGDPRLLAADATILEHAGETGAIIALLSASDVSDPAPPPLLAAPLIRALAETGELDQAIAIGTAAARPEAPDGPRRDLLFSLARIHERRNGPDDIERAFRLAEQANELLQPPENSVDYGKLFSDLASVFSAETLTRLPRSRLEDDDAVFLVGLPRCGSTLIERMLASHPQVHGAGEIPALHQIANALPQSTGSREPYPQCAAALTAARATRLGRHYLDTIRERANGAPRIINKDLGVGMHLGLVDRLLPKSRVVFCRRDPLDHGLACWMERLRPSAAPYATDLGRMGRHLRRFEKLMAHWIDATDLQILEVKYETFVADPEAESRRLIEFLELPWSDHCLHFHQSRRVDRTLSHAQVRRPVHQGSVGRAEKYAKWLAPLRDALAEPV